MLKGIPDVISPELLKVLAEMGHGDQIVIGDAYFAAAALAKDARLIRADGHSAAKMADAILQLFPLDNWAEASVIALGVDDGTGNLAVGDAVEDMLKVVSKYNEKAAQTSKTVDRFTFYEQTKKAYAVVATGEKGHYGSLMLQKGVD